MLVRALFVPAQLKTQFSRTSAEKSADVLYGVQLLHPTAVTAHGGGLRLVRIRLYRPDSLMMVTLRPCAVPLELMSVMPTSAFSSSSRRATASRAAKGVG